jgi:hypothetical protein
MKFFHKHELEVIPAKAGIQVRIGSKALDAGSSPA